MNQYTPRTARLSTDVCPRAISTYDRVMRHAFDTQKPRWGPRTLRAAKASARPGLPTCTPAAQFAALCRPQAHRGGGTQRHGLRCDVAQPNASQLSGTLRLWHSHWRIKSVFGLGMPCCVKITPPLAPSVHTRRSPPFATSRSHASTRGGPPRYLAMMAVGWQW